MKQRVAIARAYAAEPEVLLMDEPFGALDAQTRTQLQTELLETWQREKKTCFFITHDVEEAIILAQTVIIMSARPGRIRDIVKIDIPYPRTQETKMTKEFMELKNEIWSQVYGPTIISAMESGSIDVGYIGQGAHKLCINGQATIFALSHISNGDALIGGEGITSIEDLKGKQVAYSSGTSSEDILVNSLTSVGLTMDDIEAIDMDASGIVSAMLSGKVDAAATWSPNSLKILEEDANATKLADNMTFSDKTVSLASWICMPKYAEENRDVLVRFTRALFKAMDYAAADHQEDTAALIAKQIAGDQDTVYDQRGDAEWLTGKEVSEGAADGTVEGYYELQKENFIEAGAVEVDPPVSDYVLLDVMKEAGEY